LIFHPKRVLICGKQSKLEINSEDTPAYDGTELSLILKIVSADGLAIEILRI